MAGGVFAASGMGLASAQEGSDPTSTTIPVEGDTPSPPDPTVPVDDESEGEVDPAPTTSTTRPASDEGPTSTTDSNGSSRPAAGGQSDTTSNDDEASDDEDQPDDVEARDDDQGAPDGATDAPNPLLVAGPPDGRRQLTPDPEVADDVSTDGAVTTVSVPVESTDDAEIMVRRVVMGLIALAVVLAALAVYYWWITRPDRDLDDGDDSDDDPFGSDDKGSGATQSEGTVDSWLTDSTSTR